MSNIVPNSFVVLSDFHATDWPVDKIDKYYLNEYDKIYILGDAIDRGPGNQGENSFNILNKIYELSQNNPERIVYIPGNHDNLLYTAARGNSYAREDLIRNGGENTYEIYENRYSSDSPLPADRIEGLVRWIGEQPIQAVHKYNGQKYVLAHACFNQKLYDKNPNFCLKDMVELMIQAGKSSEDSQFYKDVVTMYKDVFNVLWFRKHDTNYTYNPNDLPDDDSIMVIGHTPIQRREGENLNLVNGKGKEIVVHCVDGGATFGSTTLKFDGGDFTIKTQKHDHNNTAPKVQNGGGVTQPDVVANNSNPLDAFTYVYGNTGKNLLIDIIIGALKNKDNYENVYEDLNKFMINQDISLIPPIGDLREKAKLVAPYVLGILFEQSRQKHGGHAIIYDDSFGKNFVDEVALDYIIYSSNEKFGSMKAAGSAIDNLFYTKDFLYISESVGNARTVASRVGIENMKSVIKNNECNNISEYIDKKFVKGAPLK